MVIETKTLDVLQSDIDNGERCRSFSCALALTCSREFKCRVMVGHHAIYLIDHTFNGKTSFDLWGDVKRFVSDFDNGKAVKPFRFCLS